MEHILDFDLGNTRLKWRYSVDRAIRSEGAFAHADCRIEQMPLPTERLDRVRIATVVKGELLERIVAACRRRWQLEPELAQVQQRCAGVTQGYKDPTRLGVDRWLAVLAAYKNAGRACVVVSCGTAITADLVTASGEHLGGYITPGLELMRSALFAGTNAVKLDKIERPSSLAPGRDTQAAVNRGLILMAKGLVRSAELELQQRGAEVLTIVTGGDGEWLLPYIIEPRSSTKARYRPNLVLDGLALALP